MEIVASLSQGRTAAAQCGLFTNKLVPVIFEPPCISETENNVEALRLHEFCIFKNSYRPSPKLNEDGRTVSVVLCS